ncbi:MAG: outer membrane beta-barrel protein [Cucumibacter sp.]
MRNLVAVLLLIFASGLPGAAQAADFPETPYSPPEVDYGLDGGWYIRASKDINYLWAGDIVDCACGDTTAEGWGYSLGAGIGYEFGNGFRVDKTVDYFANFGATVPGGTAYELRTTLILANAYIDFGLGDDYDASGGWMAYVGAGAGAAYYTLQVVGSVDNSAWTLAAAAMAGVGYDMGSDVIDLGYRLVYLNQLMTGDVIPGVASGVLNHEIRVTWRHRLY